MTEAALASIVVPTCNRPDLLRQCLDSVARSLASAGQDRIEVVVTDDGSDESARRLVRESYPWVRWLRGPRRGPAANRNSGVRATSGRWIMFTDDDCLVDAGWIGALLAAVTHSRDVSVLEGKTIADRGRRRLDEESPINLTGGYLWSCNMAIRRDAFDRVGGFCETFPHPAMEDVDLRLRLQAQGELATFVPEAVVCHPFRAVKGLRFAVKRGAAYVHLVERHPHLVGPTPWKSMLVHVARCGWQVARDAAACRFRGVGFAAGALLVETYFDAIARMRVAGLR